MATYFEVLGIAADATTEQIKTAYREKLLATHPDKIKQQESQQTYEPSINGKIRKAYSIESIKLAYSTLSDPNKREKYLKELSVTLQKQGIHSSGDGLDEYSLDDFKMVEDPVDSDQPLQWYMDCPRCTNVDGFHVTEDILENSGEELPNGAGYQVIIQCSMCSLWLKLNYDFSDE